MPAQPSQERPFPVGGEAPGGTGPAARRADARRNRERLLDAARAVFAAQGLDAPLSAVARRAGVGPATLYRHFPARAALVSAAFAEQRAVCAAAFDEASADPDPGRGLYTLLDTLCTTRVTDRGFAAGLPAGLPDSLDQAYARGRDCAEDRLARLVQRARAAGQLRADFDFADVTLLLLAAGGLAGQPREAALAGSRRLLAYLFQAFQPPPPQAPPLGPLPAPLAMTWGDVRR